MLSGTLPVTGKPVEYSCVSPSMNKLGMLVWSPNLSIFYGILRKTRTIVGKNTVMNNCYSLSLVSMDIDKVGLLVLLAGLISFIFFGILWKTLKIVNKNTVMNNSCGPSLVSKDADILGLLVWPPILSIFYGILKRIRRIVSKNTVMNNCYGVPLSSMSI